MTAGTPISPIIGVNFTETIAGTGTSSNQGNQFALGTKVMATYNQEWTYVHAAEAIARYKWVGIDETFEASLLTAALVAAGYQIGVADAVALANDDFGWVATKGANLTASVSAATAVDTQLYTTSTAGQLSDLALTTVGTSVATLVYGAVVTTAGTTSAAANVATMLSITPFSGFSATQSGY